MLFISRRFRMHCSINFMNQMEQIIKEHNIGVITMKYKMDRIGGHDVESVFYECHASEKDFNRMVEHIRENVKFVVGITF